MNDETVRPGITGDPSLDNDDQDNPQKGATLGGIGGAVTGAVAGSLAGPVGTLAGAIIGGIVGAVTSKAAVGAIDKIEHENRENALDVPAIAIPDEKPVTSTPVEPAAESRFAQTPLPEGASTSYDTADVAAETPEPETKTVL